MNGILKSVVGFFIGENSHKREIGVAVIAILTLLFHLDYITPDQYESMMGLAILWTGAAWNARINKIKKAFIDAKK